MSPSTVFGIKTSFNSNLARRLRYIYADLFSIPLLMLSMSCYLHFKGFKINFKHNISHKFRSKTPIFQWIIIVTNNLLIIHSVYWTAFLIGAHGYVASFFNWVAARHVITRVTKFHLDKQFSRTALTFVKSKLLPILSSIVLSIYFFYKHYTALSGAL